MKTNRLRIKLRAYDFGILDTSVQEIVQTAKNTGARVAGPIPMPTEINRYTVSEDLTSIRNHESNLK